MKTCQVGEEISPRLSLCMIVKDEALVLGACLESVKDAVDEIIIVDTGSSDETVSIAKMHGANVIHHEWQNDFSLARNLSLEHASGDWILCLDADERLDRSSVSVLRDIIAKADADGYRLEFVNYVEDGFSTISTSMLRLFRNLGHRFTGKIHEQVEHSILRRGVIKDVPVIIHHLGYLSRMENIKGKESRNISMLEDELKNDPKNSYLRFQLGVSLGIGGRHHEAIDKFIRVFRAFKSTSPEKWPEYAVRAVYLMSKSYYILGHYEYAAYWSSWALERWDITEISYQHGLIQHERRQHTDAITSFLRCLEWGDSDSSAFHSRQGEGSYLSQLAIGKIYEFVGDTETARDWYFRSFENRRDCPDTVYRLSRLITDTETLAVLSELVEKRTVMEAFCFGCAESGHDLAMEMANRLEGNWSTQTALNARLRYLGRRGKAGEQLRLLKNCKGEYSMLAKALILLNDGDMPAARTTLQAIDLYKSDAEAVADIIKGGSRTFNTTLIMPLIIDLSLKYIFDRCILSLPQNRQDEVLLEAKRAWGKRYNLSDTQCTCGVAYDLKTERAIACDDIRQARFCLDKAFDYGATITRYICRMQLERLTRQMDELRSTFETAFNEYPESLLLAKMRGRLLNI